MKGFAAFAKPASDTRELEWCHDDLAIVVDTSATATALPTSTGMARQRCGSSPRIRVINRARNSPLTNVLTKLPLSDVNRQVRDSMPTDDKANGAAQPLLLNKPSIASLHTPRWFQKLDDADGINSACTVRPYLNRISLCAAGTSTPCRSGYLRRNRCPAVR